MDSVYLKLLDGARVKNHMGLRMDEGVSPIQGKNYLHLDIPARPMEEEIKRNQHVFLEAAGAINVKGRQIVEIEPNPALSEYGSVQPSYKIHPETGEKQLGVWFSAHKSMDVSKLDYLVRLYMYA